ncbi:MAG: cell division protein FtsA [Parcubacteria group bacterium Greene0714_36]|nr:MAG: cell division protein FtsA [Parcubacteria group bacterium Greene0714_36]
MLDIGGGSSSFIVFEEGVPVHAGTIPIGGNHITGDVAIGFRQQFDVAERVKVAYGTCMTADLPKRDGIRLAEFIPGLEDVFSRRTLAEIVEARLQDLFELLQKELRRINRARLLPGGVVLVGGSSLVPGIMGLTKKELGLPVELGVPQGFLPMLDESAGPPMAAALGIAFWASGRAKEPNSMEWTRHLPYAGGQAWIIRWLRSLLP